MRRPWIETAELIRNHRKGLKMKKFFVLLALTALLAVSGCQTFRGLGSDIESLGETMQGD